MKKEIQKELEKFKNKKLKARNMEEIFVPIFMDRFWAYGIPCSLDDNTFINGKWITVPFDELWVDEFDRMYIGGMKIYYKDYKNKCKDKEGVHFTRVYYGK
jgi:hypothetical protein